MQLHLVLPGLLWPDKLLHDAVSDLDLPALSWLLGRAQLSWQPPCTLEAALCQTMGIAEEHSAYAALRLLGEQQSPAEHYWLCADPVHLALEKRRITLNANCPAASQEELQNIAVALQNLLHEEAELANKLGILSFHPGQHGRGYLQLTRQPEMQTTPPSAASGFESMQPQGPEALAWRRLLNHAQMVLHTLPCNAQRTENNLPPLNSLWLWGEGKLADRKLTQPCCTCIHGAHPLLAGLARWANSAHESALPASPADFFTAESTSKSKSALLLLDQLHAAARQYDMLQWRDALLTLEQTWLRPLQQACAQGRLQHIHITALGDDSRLDLQVNRSARWRFWRRPKALHQLARPHRIGKTTP